MSSSTFSDPHPESTAEEIANAATHGVGAALSLVGLIVLLVAAYRDGPWAVAGVSVYGASLILLFLVSTLYHGSRNEGAKQVLRSLDHSTIFLLIAGTYTPIALLAMGAGPDWLLLGLIWTLAVAGILLRLIWPGRLRWMRMTLYLTMGWLVIAWAGPLIAGVGWDGSALLLAGGLAYTIGIVFYVRRNMPFNHAIWHLFVMAGSAAHFFVIALYVL